MARKRYTAEQIHRQAAGSRGGPGPGRPRGAGGAAARRDGADLLPLAAEGRRPARGSGEAVQGAGAGERPVQAAGRRPGPGQRHRAGSVRGKLLRPARRRQAVMHVRTVVPVSARRAGRGLAQPRSTPRRPARVAADAPAWIARRITQARRFGRSGSRRITALLRAEGWRVNHKRVERLWRQEGLRVPRKPRRRLWATDGACTRRRAERPHPVWSDDCVRERTHDGRPLRVRTSVDEHTRACLRIAVARRLRSDDVLARRTALFVRHGPPAPGARTTAPRSRRPRCGPGSAGWAARHSASHPAVPGRTAPWNPSPARSATSAATPRSSTTLTEAQVRIERWRREYNQVRPHSALGYRPPTPDALEIGLPHPTPWAVRRVPVLTSRVAQRSGAGPGSHRRAR